MTPVIIYAPKGGEPWDWRSPSATGIGGSETAVTETAWRLARKARPDVKVYAPVPPDCCPEQRHADGSPTGAHWYHSRDVDFTRRGTWICHRAAAAGEFLLGQRAIHVTHDMDPPSEWTEARAAGFERILCLSRAQLRHYRDTWPFMAGKLGLWSNGIDSDGMDAGDRTAPRRDPKRLIYSSSPDRGLVALLCIFRRAYEIDPDLSLDIYYGWGASWPWPALRAEVERLADHPGVFWHGRVPQPDLHEAFRRSGLWVYPTHFTESSPVHGDTLVRTLQGEVKIRDLAGKANFRVYSCDSDGRLSVSVAHKVRCTRKNAEVIRLEFKPGRGRNARKSVFLTLTPDHEVMLRDGTYMAAGALRPGDRVKALHYQRNGWGDGYATIGVTGGPMVPEHRFVLEQKIGRALGPLEVADHVDRNTRNNAFDNLQLQETHTAHMRAHQDRMTDAERIANSRKRSDGVRRFQASLPSADLKALRSRARKVMWDRLESDPEERARFIQARADAKRSRRCSNHVVVSCEPAGRADVFCMEVEPDHNFVANGIVVHNCITAMEAQALGAIPVTRPFWALSENVRYGTFIEGDPSEYLTRARYVEEVLSLANDPREQEKIREPMMGWARRQFGWERQIDALEEMIGAGAPPARELAGALA